MHCERYTTGACRSCLWLDKDYPKQLSDKQQHLQLLLGERCCGQFLPPVASQQWAFRNKAKMVVSGSVERPILGLAKSGMDAIDLCECPLYPAAIQSVFPDIKIFIARAGLTPYNISRKRGELKFILLTLNDQNQLMLRFVLRSETKLAQLKAALPWLLDQLPQLKVVSANIQPVHMAILEGEREVVLTDEQMLEQRLNDVPLFIRPRSFFQTNSAVAASLYSTARSWVSELAIKSLWDLFCGVGGFGLHCASNNIRLTGIEISPEAISCASQSAERLGLTNVDFQALDSTLFAQGKTDIADMVLVNPPRRGIGIELCQYLSRVSPQYILYSSCNAESMVIDIDRLDGYQVDKVQLFDMFPNTAHYEVLVLLSRRKT